MSLAPDTIDASTPPRIVPVVTPMTGDPRTSGKIKHLACAPQVTHSWLVQFEDDDQGTVDYAIEPKAGRKGFVLLRDLFEAEGDHDGWAAYEKCMRKFGSYGAKPYPEDKLPKEVLRRRACGEDPDTAPVKRTRKAKTDV